MAAPDGYEPAMSSHDSNLGPLPEPTAEEPQLHPGGVDSVDDPKYGETPDDPTVPDIDPEDNAAVDDIAPPEVTEPDDKQQEPDEDDPTSEDTPSEPAS